MKRLFSIGLLVIAATNADAQTLFTAGPMPGFTELRTARIWTEVTPAADQLKIVWQAENQQHKDSLVYKGPLHQNFNPIVLTMTALEPGTSYHYQVIATGKGRTEKQEGDVTTQPLWNYRTPAPDFSFLTGSCAYINEQRYDRPGQPYGGDSSIFATMARTPADFMLWLGDNWYTREADYYSEWGLRYRAHHDRGMKVLQPLLKAMPHYAIWDDHDYGPNDFSTSYILKGDSRKVFMDYWANPTYGMDGQGIYSQFVYSDVAFFLLDDRSFRSNDAWKDSVGDGPDKHKRMFGKAQLDWLKDALLANRYATFKIIATGSQVLNPVSPYDCFRHYEAEYNELVGFIGKYQIGGVVFLTGDRHRSEIIGVERPGDYTLYDITASPLTSHVYPPGGAEKEMTARVPGTLVAEQNFAQISVTGGKDDRRLQVRFLDIKGQEKASWTIAARELQRSK